MKEIDRIKESQIQRYQLAKDKEISQIEPPSGFGFFYYIAFGLVSFQDVMDNEQKTYNDAINSKYVEECHGAMVNEMQSLYENKTWKLGPKLKDQHVVDWKWIFKAKEGISCLEAIKIATRL